MTEQEPEVLLVEGKRREMDSYPLVPYLKSLKIPPKFVSYQTNLWRGYLGTWELSENRLFLIKLEGFTEGKVPVTLQTLFPSASAKVFAEWFTGEIFLPQGKILRYQGFTPIFDEYLTLRIKKGHLLKSEIKRVT